ncbi:cilia- and flagella-associated protein 300 isoform X3 [Heterodontus francisci]|uniref:cilia- and flagella-associated protein 300 isoform X3 n=1 Tax=Heterodontus francisci TaxID=7792 RepID=UPI00355B033E
MAAEAGVKRAFTFRHLSNKMINFMEDNKIRDLFVKWSMHGRITVQVFSFDQHFQAYEKDNFVRAFFQDPNVMANLKVLSALSCEWATLVGTEVKKIEAEEVPCNQLSMLFFDCLYTEGIVRETGHITKCLDEFYEDFTISDQLQQRYSTETGPSAHQVCADQQPPIYTDPTILPYSLPPTYTRGNLQWPIYLSSCKSLAVGGNRSTQRKPTRAQGELANSAQAEPRIEPGSLEL